MKKLFLFVLICFFAISGLNARTVDVSAMYVGASHLTEIKANATAALTLNTLASLEAKYIDEEDFKDPIYAVSVPVQFDFDYLKLNLTPFYYFKNKSDNPAFQDASAFGLNTQIMMTLEDDTVNDLYTHAFVGISVARQKGTLFTDDGDHNQYYTQMAYTLGIHRSFYQAFGFEAAATAFQYPDGITGVNGFRGIMDQQDLAFTQTYDVVHDLAKYTLSARITRMWVENFSTLYVAYRFGEYYSADPEHSVLIGNTCALTLPIRLDAGYNHVRTVHNENKRDIFYIRLIGSF